MQHDSQQATGIDLVEPMDVSGSDTDISTWTPSIIQALVNVNADQKRQLALIIAKLNSLTSIVASHLTWQIIID